MRCLPSLYVCHPDLYDKHFSQYNIQLYVDCIGRRTLGYEDVLEKLEQKGISIRVASPKLVMEEVWHTRGV